MEVTREPEPVRKFGHPATRMRLRMTKEAATCGPETAVFHSTADGYIQYAYPGNVLDVWVVDVDGVPIYVQKLWSPNAPQGARSELDGIIGSLRFT